MAAWADTIANLNNNINQGLGLAGQTINDIGTFHNQQAALRQSDKTQTVDAIQKAIALVNQNQQLASDQKARINEIMLKYQNDLGLAKSLQEAQAARDKADADLKRELEAGRNKTTLEAAQMSSGGSGNMKSSDLYQIFSNMSDRIFSDNGWMNPDGSKNWSKANKDQFLKELQAGSGWLTADQQKQLLQMAGSLNWGPPGTTVIPLPGNTQAAPEVPPGQSAGPLGGIAGGATTAGAITRQEDTRRAMDNASKVQDLISKLIASPQGQQTGFAQLGQQDMAKITQDIAALKDQNPNNDQAAIDEINRLLSVYSQKPKAAQQPGLLQKIWNGIFGG